MYAGLFDAHVAYADGDAVTRDMLGDGMQHSPNHQMQTCKCVCMYVSVRRNSKSCSNSLLLSAYKGICKTIS